MLLGARTGCRLALCASSSAAHQSASPAGARGASRAGSRGWPDAIGARPREECGRSLNPSRMSVSSMSLVGKSELIIERRTRCLLTPQLLPWPLQQQLDRLDRAAPRRALQQRDQVIIGQRLITSALADRIEALRELGRLRMTPPAASRPLTHRRPRDSHRRARFLHVATGLEEAEIERPALRREPRRCQRAPQATFFRGELAGCEPFDECS